jgi:hypothetical protein
MEFQIDDIVQCVKCDGAPELMGALVRVTYANEGYLDGIIQDGEGDVLGEEVTFKHDEVKLVERRHFDIIVITQQRHHETLKQSIEGVFGCEYRSNYSNARQYQMLFEVVTFDQLDIIDMLRTYRPKISEVHVVMRTEKY